jgi:hypothetical protein
VEAARRVVERVAKKLSDTPVYLSANSIGGKLDIVDFSNPSVPTLLSSISMAPYGNINSISVKNGIVATAIENISPQLNGKVVFFNSNGTYLNEVGVGAMPDMITFNTSGTKVITANEGEPNTAYTSDPLGSISIIDVSGGIASLSAANVTTLDFTAYNSQISSLKAAGIRIFGPGATVAQDMEPEYVTVSNDDSKAWVSCQENNALVEINLLTNSITSILPLGTKDLSLWGSEDYSLLNTDKWQVPMPRPPVCINNNPCKVCPTDEPNGGYPINLKNWNSSRQVSNISINKDWANSQFDSNDKVVSTPAKLLGSGNNQISGGMSMEVPESSEGRKPLASGGGSRNIPQDERNFRF